MNTRDPGADTATTSHVQDPDDDAPTQPITPTSRWLLDERRTRAIKAIFGLPEDAIPSWPGLQVVCAHIESCFDVLLGDESEFYWWRSTVHKPNLKESHEIWDWCLDILHDSFGRTLGMNDPRFAALCCVSLILRPKSFLVETIRFENYVSPAWEYSDHDKEDSLLLDIRDSFKISGVLHTIEHRENQSPDIERAGIHGDTGMIYENTVNFDSLSTVGRLTVRWVDSIANHLVFDQEKHVVCVFRFPTFSAAMIEGITPTNAGQHW